MRRLEWSELVLSARLITLRDLSRTRRLHSDRPIDRDGAGQSYLSPTASPQPGDETAQANEEATLANTRSEHDYRTHYAEVKRRPRVFGGRYYNRMPWPTLQVRSPTPAPVTSAPRSASCHWNLSRRSWCCCTAGWTPGAASATS
jgi:hypothetical protein